MTDGATQRSLCQSPAATASLTDLGILTLVLLACLLAPVNATMVVVALPRVISEFAVPAWAGSLVVTAYLVTMAVVPPLAGWLGDRRSRRTLLLAGLTVVGLAALGADHCPRAVPAAGMERTAGQWLRPGVSERAGASP